jgi:hypothetical protein
MEEHRKRLEKLLLDAEDCELIARLTRMSFSAGGGNVTGPVVPGFFLNGRADHRVSGVRVGEDLCSLRSSC